MADDLLKDLRTRLLQADEELTDLYDNPPSGLYERHRVGGKREGVRLALSYVEEALRGTAAGYWICTCGHSIAWHRFGPSNPGGLCEVAGPQANDDGCPSKCAEYRPSTKQEAPPSSRGLHITSGQRKTIEKAVRRDG